MKITWLALLLALSLAGTAAAADGCEDSARNLKAHSAVAKELSAKAVTRANTKRVVKADGYLMAKVGAGIVKVAEKASAAGAAGVGATQ